MDRSVSFLDLPPFDDGGLLNTIIETPKGARNKFVYDEKLQLFRLKKVLPAGAVFPFDFGFIPHTWAEDEGPLDVLVLVEEPAFPGCLVSARLLGVIEAAQTKLGRRVRNDRFVAVADKMPSFDHCREMQDLEPALILQIEHFFVSYNKADGKEFEVLRRSNPARARELISEGEKLYGSRHRCPEGLAG